MKKFTIKDTIWRWNGGQGSWHFINVSDSNSEKIKDAQPKTGRRGFGAVKVRATLGKTVWETSIFPTKDGPYILPMKASVRSKERAQDGDRVTIQCELL
jgi:hypothetical protein